MRGGRVWGEKPHSSVNLFTCTQQVQAKEGNADSSVRIYRYTYIYVAAIYIYVYVELNKIL